jgi:endonuclease/exonuclease/phosphatase family metal-dependent hydrolase
MTLLDVATLNIWHDAGPWPQRRELILDELTLLKPDLVGLQEVLGEPDGHGQAEELASPLGYEVVYAAASRRSDGAWLGNALLSRLPVRRSRTVALPAEDVEPRSMLFALVDTVDGELPVFVTHLAWEHDLGPVRGRQIDAILEGIERSLADLPAAHEQVMPCLLMGDFNAAPGADELLPLEDGWVDAWSVAGSGPGFTFDPENDYARPWEEPAQRIDYLFVEADPRVLIHLAETAFAAPRFVRGHPIWPSDHYGIACRLELLV